MKGERQKTIQVKIGSVFVGGDSPVVIQSMTSTETENIAETTSQILELTKAGAKIVRLTVNDEQAARAVPLIKDKLIAKNCLTPLVGCFHYNGHTLLNKVGECAEALDKYRINPGNVGFGELRDKNFEIFIKHAINYNKPVRIGVNLGSIDEITLAKLMDKNSKKRKPDSANIVMQDAMVQSALISAEHAEKLGLSSDKIVLSAKASDVTSVLAVYRKLKRLSKYALHLGLTEAGTGTYGIIATTAALSILLNEGIGDTIRASLTPKPGEKRSAEVEVCKQILQSLGLQQFSPTIIACPGCGRTNSEMHRKFAEEITNFVKESVSNWQRNHTKFANDIAQLKIAVMGCVVNGPGESKHADIGISMPGTTEKPCAMVFVDGKKHKVITGNNIIEEFKEILERYICNRFSDFTTKDK